MAMDAGWLKEHIRDIPDFPKPGVTYKDITPLLGDEEAFRFSVDTLAGQFDGSSSRPAGAVDKVPSIDKVLGIEARGFILAAPIAYRFGCGFVPVRKAGKLPWEVEKEEYVLEYGTDLLEIHGDALRAGERVLIIDDVLATGGTAAATVRLVEKLGGQVVGLGFVLELAFLEGRARLAGHRVSSLLAYE